MYTLCSRVATLMPKISASSTRTQVRVVPIPSKRWASFDPTISVDQTFEEYTYSIYGGHDGTWNLQVAFQGLARVPNRSLLIGSLLNGMVFQNNAKFVWIFHLKSSLIRPVSTVNQIIFVHQQGSWLPVPSVMKFEEYIQYPSIILPVLWSFKVPCLFPRRSAEVSLPKLRSYVRLVGEVMGVVNYALPND